MSDDQDHREELTAEATATIDLLIRPRRTAFGSVEGKLETVSVHGRPRYVMYHGRTHKAVTCKIEPGEGVERAMALMGHRVNVAGRVHYNERGEPLRIDEGEIRPLRDHRELPTTADLTGGDPDFTGGLSTAAYLETMRSG